MFLWRKFQIFEVFCFSLQDKWRNLLRASRAQLHPPKQVELTLMHSSCYVVDLFKDVQLPTLYASSVGLHLI